MFPLPSSSLISAWCNYFTTSQLIYTGHMSKITQSSVLFHSCPSMASKGIPSHIVMTWSLSPTPSFIWRVENYLRPPFPLPKTSTRRKNQSQWKSCAKAYLLPSANLSTMSIPLASTRSQTINTFIPSSHSAQRPRPTTSAKCYPALLSSPMT